MGVAAYNAECRKIVSRYSVSVGGTADYNELGCINSSNHFLFCVFFLIPGNCV